MLSAALPPCLAECLRLSGQCRSLRPPPRRLEGSAFQPARRRLSRTHALREGRAFPHDRRRSRRSSPTGSRIIWRSLSGPGRRPSAARPYLGRETFAKKNKKLRDCDAESGSPQALRLVPASAIFRPPLRSVEKYSEKAEHDQLNPITAGPVKRAEEWQRSSGHDYTRGLAEKWLSST